jgi:tetratricopeptide (TPR) repeat protein
VEAARPDDPAVHEAIGYIRRRQGRLDEAIERLERAVRLDPQNAHIVLMLAGTHAGRRHHAIADSLFDRVIALEPDSPAAYEEKAANVLSWRGSVAEARAITARIPGRTDDARSLFAARFDVLERDFAAAEQRLRRLDPAQLPSAANFMEHVMLYGEVLQRLGRQDEAAAWLAAEHRRPSTGSSPTTPAPSTSRAAWRSSTPASAIAKRPERLLQAAATDAAERPLLRRGPRVRPGHRER